MLIDFGSARRLAHPMEHVPDPPHTTNYAAPEVFLEEVGFSSDWWSLGMVVAELATGTHPLAGMQEHSIRFHVAINDEVPIAPEIDPEIRLLCEGLLVRQPTYRWGAQQVRKWLDHEPVAVPAWRGPAAEPDQRAAFAYRGTEYRDRVSLAAELAAHWRVAAEELFGVGERWPELCGWLAQFDGPGTRETSADLALRLSSACLPPDAALLVLLRWLHPGADAVYLGWHVGVGDLARIARTAADAATTPGSDQAAIQVVTDLWEHELLPYLDGARQGHGLADIDARWRAFTGEWDRAARRIAASSAELGAAIGQWQGPTLRAWLLWLASDPGKDAMVRGWLESVRQAVRRRLGDSRARIDWFDDLVNSAVTPGARLAAYVVSGVALREAARIQQRHRIAGTVQEVRDTQWRQLELARQWDRSVALGWAAASAAVLTAGWLILLQAASRLASPTAQVNTVNTAWLYVSCAVIAQVIIELAVAAVIGGPYHPRFSLFSRMIRWAGWIGRTFSQPSRIVSRRSRPSPRAQGAAAGEASAAGGGRGRLPGRAGSSPASGPSSPWPPSRPLACHWPRPPGSSRSCCRWPPCSRTPSTPTDGVSAGRSITPTARPGS